jgi:integrase
MAPFLPLAAQTGFRANEIRSLTAERFRLAGNRPTIVLKPPDAKNRRGVEQPISQALAARLRPFLAGKHRGKSVFTLHHETAKAIRIDLERAGIAYETDEGFAGFHSLRGYYVSALIRSRASIKTVQTLARHSNPSLTLARYARANVHDVLGAVESLPALTPRAFIRDQLACYDWN